MDKKTIYHETTCEFALNELKRKIPYGQDLNIYRGCEHGCKYCYAMYSHKYLGDDDFFKDIYIKTNIVDKLEQQLKSANWKREVVNIGGVTDSYQQAEATYKLMPDILKLLIKYKTPAIISTKSTLALRDYDLIDELSRLTYINIAATITTMDEQVQKLIEPNSAPSLKRFEMLKEFRKTNASVGLHLMPIIPYITDDYENMDALLTHAMDAGVHYVLPGVLYLRGDTKSVFMQFISEQFPHLYDNIALLYKKGGADKTYKDEFYKMFNGLREKYSVPSSYMKPMKEKLMQSKEIQLSLFE